MPNVVVIIAGVALLIVVVMIVAWRSEVNRREAVRRLAAEMGFGFLSEGPGSTAAIPSRLEVFRRGRRPRARNVITGRIEDLGVHLFDYAYTTGTGRNQRRHRHTIVAFELPHRKLPDFDLRPEHVLHKFISVLGYQDIDFADRPGFSDRWLLRGRDEAAVRAFFTPEIMDLLAHRGKIGVAAGEGCLVVYRSRGRVPTTELPRFLEEAFAICNAMA